MTREEAKHKLDFMKKAYQKLIDEKVDSGKLVGDGVRGEWKAEAPLDEAYKDMIEALDMAIKALEAYRAHEEFMEYLKDNPVGGYSGDNHNW